MLLASYAKFLKIHATIEWKNISKIIRKFRRDFFLPSTTKI